MYGDLSARRQRWQHSLLPFHEFSPLSHNIPESRKPTRFTLERVVHSRVASRQEIIAHGTTVDVCLIWVWAFLKQQLPFHKFSPVSHNIPESCQPTWFTLERVVHSRVALRQKITVHGTTVDVCLIWGLGFFKIPVAISQIFSCKPYYTGKLPANSVHIRESSTF